MTQNHRVHFYNYCLVLLITDGFLSLTLFRLSFKMSKYYDNYSEKQSEWIKTQKFGVFASPLHFLILAIPSCDYV